ncbi:PREDICTED: neural cell adhesion molecule L1-like protein [Hipposideros armiger]|uniref:Neural cell adhesion molecule L1-like protein n=1 Tax=Hipposideros armiger TaxID=186990 RepID=A0A8B7SEA2_HIPAR|nr:PREDICTED: neural cell adhesion molecule L1-like protein [Hipposideros armiger]
METLLSGRGLILSLIFFLFKFSMAIEIPLSVQQVPTITKQSKVQVAFPFDEYFQIECEAKGNPEPAFTWTKDDKPFDLSDPRIIVSNDSGTFKIPNEGHVAHFQGKYRCFASNKLGVAMSEEIEFIVPNVPKFPKEKIEPLEVEEGDPIVLPCNPPTGLPPLHIYWMNIELEHIEQDERVYMSQEGDLYFANVEERDSRSDYCCFAAFPRLRTIVQKMPMKLTVNSLKHANDSSSSTDIDFKANSIKQRKPRLLLPPVDRGPESSVTILRGDTLLLECFAEGIPTPQVDWEKVDGDLPKGRETKESYGKTLKIENVSFQDKGVYRCTATNLQGWATHDFHVTVEDVHPLIQTEDGEAYAAVVGASAFLHCEFFASPKAVVTWQKVEEAKPLEGDRFHVHDNGTLQLNTTTEDDAGQYSCWVVNAKGRTAVTASLEVRSEFSSYSAWALPWARFAFVFPDERKPASREDFFPSSLDGFRWGMCILERLRSSCVCCLTFLTYRASPCRVSIDGANLTISAVTLGDQGTYACSAQTELDSITNVTQVTVLDVPDPPKHLRLSEKQDRSVRLTWDAGDSHNSDISEYLVEFEGNREEPGRWEQLRRVQGAQTSVLLPLAPYVTYRFRVVAVNEVGRSRPSSPSERHETPPAAPDKNPQNIRVQASQPKEMIIKWEPLKSMEQNGPGLEYRVTWKPQGASVEWEEETVTNHTLRVMTPTVYAPYEVQVQATNSLGAGPEPQPVILFSGEDYPDAAPRIQGVDVINSTVVKVTWSAIPKDRVHGRLKGYQVNWWKTKSLLDGRAHPKRVNTLRFSGQRNYGMVPSLDAFSEFHLSIFAYNSKGAGPESEPYTFQTPEGVPEQPTFLKVVQVDKDAATLSWGLPKKLNGNLTGYVLQYQIINDTDEIGELNDINITTPSKPSWRLSNLSATTKYKFYVRACTAQGCGKPITEETTTTGASSKTVGKSPEGVNVTRKAHPVEAFEPGAEPIVRLLTKSWVDNNSIFEDVIETRGREYAGLYDDIATQGWFIGLMCAIALLTLTLLTICFVKRNKGGKYSVKEKEDLHPDPEGQSGKDETFGDYSDSDEKPLKGSLRSLARDTQATGSADSLVEYGEGEQGLFGEDGSFIGAYAGPKEKGSVEGSAGSSTAFPLRA